MTCKASVWQSNVRRVAHSHFSTLRLSRFSANAKCQMPILGERRIAGVERHEATLGLRYEYLGSQATTEQSQSNHSAVSAGRWLTGSRVQPRSRGQWSPRARSVSGRWRSSGQPDGLTGFQSQVPMRGASSPFPLRERSGYNAREAAVAARSPRPHDATMVAAAEASADVPHRARVRVTTFAAADCQSAYH